MKLGGTNEFFNFENLANARSVSTHSSLHAAYKTQLNDINVSVIIDQLYYDYLQVMSVVEYY